MTSPASRDLAEKILAELHTANARILSQMQSSSTGVRNQTKRSNAEIIAQIQQTNIMVLGILYSASSAKDSPQCAKAPSPLHHLPEIQGMPVWQHHHHHLMAGMSQAESAATPVALVIA